jgi:hypothetical protein
MMMECPRCGFSQPKDRYCANCGLDVEHFQARPKPLWIRLLQNPNFHLSLIGLLIVLVIGYILYSRSELMTREMGHFMGTPLTSREAADPDDEPPPEPLAARTAPASDEAEASRPEPSPAPEANKASPAATADSKPADTPATLPRKLDVAFWEVPRELLASLMVSAEKAGESNEGRSYLFKDGDKIANAVRSGSRRLTLNRMADLKRDSQIVVVTPPNSAEPFQFGLMVQVVRVATPPPNRGGPPGRMSPPNRTSPPSGAGQNLEATVNWESQLVLPQPESPQEAALQQPAVKSAIEVAMAGSATLSATNLLMLVIEPGNRRPRFEYLAHAGEGPWSVFSSDDFRAGLSDWVILVQLE